MVSLIWILLITACLCLVLKNNMLLFFIALELIVLAINLNFIFFSINNEDSQGLYVALLLLALAAIDTAIGLSLLLKFFRTSLFGDIRLSALTYLKG